MRDTENRLQQDEKRQRRDRVNHPENGQDSAPQPALPQRQRGQRDCQQQCETQRRCCKDDVLIEAVLDVAAVTSQVISTDPGVAIGEAAALGKKGHSVDTSVNVGITLDAVGKTYPGRDGGTVAVRELSMQVPAGLLVAFVGPSGCGKTTTLKMINRLIEP